MDGLGGTIQGDEEVLYGNDSTKDYIKIQADTGYTIEGITVNGKTVDIDNNLTSYTLDNFKEMKEDKLVIVKFTPVIENPKTGISIFTIPTIIISSISLLTYLFIRRKKLFNRL